MSTTGQPHHKTRLKDKLSRILHWWTIRRVGLAALVLALLIGFLGYMHQHPGRFTLDQFVADYYANVSTELLSLAITVLIFDYLIERRHRRELAARLARALGSQNAEITLQAFWDLAAHGWLQDGSLRRAYLRGARLPGLDLSNADLREADLGRAHLQDANLQEANLQGTDFKLALMFGANLQGANLKRARLLATNLGCANLRRANLQEANLVAASLEGARLDGANLEGALMNDLEIPREELSRAGQLRHAVMPDGTRYDGRMNLEGDIQTAGNSGVETSDSAAMAHYFGVSLEQYLRGQAWARTNLPKRPSNPAQGPPV